MKKTKEQQGITLVALIITIIVLLILAVVAIAALSGDGIIQHAKDSTASYKVKQAEEAAQLILDEWKIVKHSPNSDKNFETFLSAKVTEGKIQGSVKNLDGTWTLTIDGQQVKVTETNVISSVNSGTTGGGDNETPDAPQNPEEPTETVNYVKIGDLVYLITNEENKTAAVYGARAEGVDYSAGGFAIMNDCVMAEEEVTIASQVQINGKTYTVTEIGYWGFKGASSLKKLTIPGTVKLIISVATFDRCTSLETIIMEEGVSELADTAFSECKALTNITIPNSITLVGSNPFSGTVYYKNLEENSTGNYIIAGSILLSAKNLSGDVELPAGITAFAHGAFSGNDDMTSVSIPETVTAISANCFRNCDSLASIELHGKITTISYGAFEHCVSLKSITIPNSVIKVGEGILFSNDSLETINVYWENNTKPEEWHENWNESSATVNNLWQPAQ